MKYSIGLFIVFLAVTGLVSFLIYKKRNEIAAALTKLEAEANAALDNIKKSNVTALPQTRDQLLEPIRQKFVNDYTYFNTPTEPASNLLIERPGFPIIGAGGQVTYNPPTTGTTNISPIFGLHL